MRKVEWIGVETPLADDRVNYRRMAGLYTSDEEALLETVTEIVTPLVRVFGSTARAKGPKDGYSKTYQWGPRRFICEMEDIDADRMFESDPDEAEFRDLENGKHDARVPLVPWMYINKAMERMLSEARNGPGLVLVGAHSARTTREIDRMLTQSAELKQEIHERKQAQRTRR